jgi:MFS family permease
VADAQDRQEADTAAVLQPYSGRRIDAGRVNPSTASLSLAACAAGFVIAAAFTSIAGLAIAAVLIGAGVAVATPLGFTLVARSAPAERMGRTMGAAEVGRELGDAGGPVLVGAFSLISLTAGLGALALALLACAGLVRPGNSRQLSDPP